MNGRTTRQFLIPDPPVQTITSPSVDGTGCSIEAPRRNPLSGDPVPTGAGIAVVSPACRGSLKAAALLACPHSDLGVIDQRSNVHGTVGHDDGDE